MILRVETSLTLGTNSGHYIKHVAVLEADWDDIVHLMGGDSTLDDKAIRRAYKHLNELVTDTVWDVIESQLNSLEGD